MSRIERDCTLKLLRGTLSPQPVYVGVRPAERAARIMVAKACCQLAGALPGQGLRVATAGSLAGGSKRRR